jgi:tRNA pseudouridine55 synthase
MPEGFLVLDKPAGQTSARALDAVKRRFGRGTKVGHAGTLDPFATGVLVALVGRATKKSNDVMAMPKTYDATLRLGVTTETLDPESAEVPDVSAKPAAMERVTAVLAACRGEIQQTPPAYSAIKVAGRRAYDLARGGADVVLPPRPVMVYDLQLIEYAWPTLRISMRVGRGFYVRSLARDLAIALGTTGYLTDLRRNAVGCFEVEKATGVEGELLPLEVV